MTASSMPQPNAASQLPHDLGEAVLGVDTHKDVHVAAVVSVVGVLLGSQEFPASEAGYQQLSSWARSLGQVVRAGVEGTGSYGAALTRHLQGEGVTVIEVNRPDRQMRRSRGKSDATDAHAAAMAVLSGRATAIPKAGDGQVEQMRIYKVAKDSAVKSRTQAINQLKMLLVNAEPWLRASLTGLTNVTLVARCAELRPEDHSGTVAASMHTLRLLAHRIQYLNGEVRDLERCITDAIKAVAPDLLEEFGVGADSAAILLIAAGDNPGRLRDEASFAALCGVSPVEASSGKSRRRRLNRGGDRQANAALFRVILTRLRCDERTRDYVVRRTADGLSKREIMRCLKRYLARTLFRIIRPAISVHSAPVRQHGDHEPGSDRQGPQALDHPLESRPERLRHHLRRPSDPDHPLIKQDRDTPLTGHTHTWWSEKLAKNVARDIATNEHLQQAGWHVIRIWEHEEPSEAATRIVNEVMRHGRAGGA
ncbi:transposase [Nonomuraea jabiensis]|uniref:Transposase n=1 Tax=Nonomuraea jabiensis TaxID=882448 RepID=A0A7W9G0T9_9ACTN|nr:IS110 family transposase [Nonomuraea jabiensis]MBB5775042.1 transposase [Nonomuraea jabiensis]